MKLYILLNLLHLFQVDINSRFYCCCNGF